MDTKVTCHLLLLLCLVTGIAAKATHRQGDALDKLRQHRPRSSSPPWHDKLRASDVLSPSRRLGYAQAGLKERDRVTSLPGQALEGLAFNQYAGYVTVDADSGRALFYYLAEAVGPNPASKPLLLWLNGGPGCSSLGYGAMEELGPFRVMSDGKTLYRNPYSWNNVANVIFLESPAGVGFSYSNTSADYGQSGDQQTAEDAYTFLVNWMERFPEYKGREFYIAGESYAGHYVPQLAVTVLRHRAAGKTSGIDLKGIMIGNAVINDATDEQGMYDYFWTHALISDLTIDAIHSYCNFTGDDGGRSDQQCEQALSQAGTVVEDLDVYNIYAPLCTSTGLTSPPKKPSIDNFDPCTDTYVVAYLNDPKVQEALHANVTRLNHSWTPCSELIGTWQDSPSTVLPLIKELMSNNIRVWVYSGDVDGRVPVTSTRYSVSQLQLPVAAPWRPWFTNENGSGDVGGFIIGYNGSLTLATVRGAGHEVPSYQPQRALVLAQYFLTGKPLPGCNSDACT